MHVSSPTTPGSQFSSEPSTNPSPTKVFGIGLSKTGTSSLCAALQVLGYSVVDFDSGLKHIAEYDAATDAPIADAFEKLDEQYPGSKFIYTVRNRDDWLRSIAGTWKLLRLIPETWKADDLELFRRLYGTQNYRFNAKLFAEAYDRHDRRVRGYFKDRDLLTMDICSGDGWEPLCSFLGQPKPDQEFPRINVNMSPSMLTKLQLRRLQRRRVVRKLTGWAFGQF